MIALCSSRKVGAIAHESARLRAPGTAVPAGRLPRNRMVGLGARSRDARSWDGSVARCKGDRRGSRGRCAPVGGEPIDITGFDAFRQGDYLKVQLETAAPMSPADSGRPDALFGFIDFDIDQQQGHRRKRYGRVSEPFPERHR